MRYDDFDWEDILLEAPGDQPPSDDLGASDYTNTDNLEVNDVSDTEDLGSEDYTQVEDEPSESEEVNDNEDAGNDMNTEDDSGMEDMVDTSAGLDGEDSSEEGMDDDSLNDEQQDNTENDPQGQQNKYLAHDFIELYNRQQEIINKIRRDNRLKAFTNPTTSQVKHNLEKLSKVTYDYIIDKFNKETYVANLYQFNLIIQAMNLNIQMLEEVNERILKDEEKQLKKKKQKTKK